MERQVLMENPESTIREINLEELIEKRRRGEPFILVDVLEHEHYEHIRIPGSINVPLRDLRMLAPLLFGKEEQIIVYCTSPECTASLTAAKILMQLGYANVLDFTGGLKEWVESGQPIFHAKSPPSSEGQQAA